MKKIELSKMDCLVLGFFVGVIVGCLLQFLPPVELSTYRQPFPWWR